MELKPMKIEAELMWAFLDKPNEMSGKYQVDLCNLSKNAVKALEDIGVSVRKREDKPEKGFFITAKSSNYPITTVDTTGNLVAAKVGNGSKGIALIKPYEYTYRNKKGVGVGINKLTITELVEYTNDKSEEQEEDEVVL
jgi:hypothetical protein